MYDKRKSAIQGWGGAVVIASIGLAGWLAPEAATASCVAPPEPELLWTYPADGQESVPVDTQVRMLFNTHLFDKDWQATLNDTPVTRDAEVFSFDRLAANTLYTFRLEGHQPRSITQHKIEIHFRTGSESAAEIAAPDVLGTVKVDNVEAVQGLCARVDSLYHCRDTPTYDLRGVMLEAEGAIGWLDAANNLWPVSCNPFVDAGIDRKTCIGMRAVAANGSQSEITDYCPADEARAMSRTQAQSADMQSAGCAVVSPGQQRAGAGWLAFFALVALVWSRAPFAPRRRCTCAAVGCRPAK